MLMFSACAKDELIAGPHSPGSCVRFPSPLSQMRTRRCGGARWLKWVSWPEGAMAPMCGSAPLSEETQLLLDLPLKVSTPVAP